eukprot:TRINITY_DN50957_c0_g1_i1.p1 TRINITY_DN50957_c0_g1~~TRINITY_DN50957_c0_g1_i1.p1  ORF type:complete len:478 (+),score=110.94 TRINITY_DN50957_c0_g1_i1:71-1435(+)
MASRRRGWGQWQASFNPFEVEASAPLEISRGVPQGSPSPQRRHLTLRGDGDRTFHIDPDRNIAFSRENSPRGIRAHPPRSDSPHPLWSENVSPRRERNFHIDPSRNTGDVAQRRPRAQSPHQQQIAPSPFGTELTALHPGERASVFHVKNNTALSHMSPRRTAAAHASAQYRSRSAPVTLLHLDGEDAASQQVSMDGSARRARSPRFMAHLHPSVDERNCLTGSGMGQSGASERPSRRVLPEPPTACLGRERSLRLDPVTMKVDPPGQRFAQRPERNSDAPGHSLAGGTLHSGPAGARSSPSRRGLPVENDARHRAGTGGFGSSNCEVGALAESSPRPGRRLDLSHQGGEPPYGLSPWESRRHAERRPVGKSLTWLSRVGHQRRKVRYGTEGEMEPYRAAPTASESRARPLSRRSGKYETAATCLSPAGFLNGGVGLASAPKGRRVYEQPPKNW